MLLDPWFWLVIALYLGAILTWVYWAGWQRQAQLHRLTQLGDAAGLRYRSYAHGWIPKPVGFLLDERLGAAAELGFIERSLVPWPPQRLPALFEYVTYRDVHRGRQWGTPALVLAVPVDETAPSLRVRPYRLYANDQYESQSVDWFWPQALWPWTILGEITPEHSSRLADPTTNHRNVTAEQQQAIRSTGFWLQRSNGVLYIIQPPRPWRMHVLTVENLADFLPGALCLVSVFAGQNTALLLALRKQLDALQQTRPRRLLGLSFR